MTIKDYYNVFNSISFRSFRPFRCLLLWDGGSVPIIFPGFFIKFWVCDVSLTGRVSRIWGTMGLWATLDCVWDVVDPFIYGTETITKSFFAVKWNQVFKKKSVCCHHGLSCCFNLSEFFHGSSSSGWSLLSLYFKPTFQPISKLLTHSIISLLIPCSLFGEMHASMSA